MQTRTKTMKSNWTIPTLAFCAAGLLGLQSAHAFPARAPDGEPIVETRDEPVHHVILENDYVTVMRVMILPGQRTMWHEQHLDYVNTHISGSPVKIEYIGQPVKTAVMETGHIRFGPHQGKSEVDRITNTGTTLNHQVAFEIKKDGPENFGGDDRAKVAGFTLALDKPTVRGWHVKLEPGQSTGVYTQKGPGVRVIFSGNRLLLTSGDKKVTQDTIQAADAFLLEPGTRSITNAGNTTLEFNEYELK